MFKFTLKHLFIILTYICFCLGNYKLALIPFANKNYDIKEMLKIPTTNVENNIKLRDAMLERDNKVFLFLLTFILNGLIFFFFKNNDFMVILLLMINLLCFHFFVFKEVIL